MGVKKPLILIVADTENISSANKELYVRALQEHGCKVDCPVDPYEITNAIHRHEYAWAIVLSPVQEKKGFGMKQIDEALDYKKVRTLSPDKQASTKEEAYQQFSAMVSSVVRKQIVKVFGNHSDVEDRR